MIHFFMFCYFVYGLYKCIELLSNNDHEFNAMCYVGKTEFDKAKETMTNKDFKKFVKENSQKMKQAWDYAAAYNNLPPEEKQKIIDHTVKLHEERLKKELEQWRNK